MSEDLLSQIFIKLNLLNFIKPSLLVLIAIYLLFSLVIIRQVGLMTSFLGTSTSPVIKALSWAHLLVAVGIFILVLLFL